MFRGFDSGAVYKMGMLDIFGAPGGIRTHGPRIRNLIRGYVLYHTIAYYQGIPQSKSVSILAVSAGSVHLVSTYLPRILGPPVSIPRVR